LLVMSVTELEIDEAIREAWTILYAEPAASPSARRLAAALLAITGGTPAHPHWVTPNDLWRDRLAVLADQGVWLTAWVRGRVSRTAGCPCPAAGKPDKARECLSVMAFNRAGQRRCRQREQDHAQTTVPAPE
jgi:hypothetical protein